MKATLDTGETKMNKKLLLPLIGLSTAVVAFSILIANTASKDVSEITATNFSFTLNSSNGRITDSSFSDSIKVTTNGKTGSNNNFSLSYYHAKGKSGSYCVLDAENPRTNKDGEDGYIYTTNGVNGLDSITINYSYQNSSIPGDLLVYFSDSSTFSGTPVIAESGKEILANGSYFKIQALSQSVIINSLQIKYSCNESTHEYPEEASITHTSKPVTSLTVSEPTNTLPSDFVFGVDMSMVAENEELGGIYKNENNVAEDPFQILADDGANYARIRLWVDPYSTSGVSYEGGTNDLATDIHLAKRAKAAGMKVLLDLHYSDFWADPDTYWKPKSWSTANASTVTSYTTTVLNAFKDEGIIIDSVQVGNEINTGIAGIKQGTTTYYNMLNAGVSAVKSVYPEAKTILHLTNITRSTIYNFIDNLCSNVNNFDVLGLSYYAFWHGDIDNLLSVMNYIANKGKDVMVLETSWGYTLTGDPNWYSTQTFYPSATVDTSKYDISNQGQMDCLCAIVDALSKVNNKRGKGIFYWGPDYLAIKGAHWASVAGQNYNDYGVDGDVEYDDDSCRIAWANQSLFDYDGKVMGSAQTYLLLKDDVAPVDPGTTYTQDTTDMTYGIVTFNDPYEYSAASPLTYDETTDNWTTTIQITSLNQGVEIYSSNQGTWTNGGVGDWYFSQVNSSLFNASSPYAFKETGTYNITIKDSLTDGDVSTSFGYYMANWNNSGIISCISIVKA